MAISNYIPNSRIQQAGVCTSTTRPASPYNGQVIYETDTGRTLVWNSTAWVFLSTGTANPVGLEFIKTTSLATGTSNIDISNCFSTTYSAYKMVFSGMTTGAAIYCAFQMLDSGGTPASSNYTTTRFRIYSTGSVAEGVSAQTVGHLLVSDTSGSSCEILITTPFEASRTLLNSSGQYGGNASTAQIELGNTVHTTASSYTGIRLIASGSTWVAGNVSVYGYKK